MKVETLEVLCTKHFASSRRQKPFRLVKCTFNYGSDPGDRQLVETIIARAKVLAGHVNAGAANNALLARSLSTITNNCIAGVTSEYCWKYFLNDNGNTQRVVETPFYDAMTQIDLRLVTSAKSIEVRSSFPRNGIQFAICHPTMEFDVIGPYSNSYKSGEVKKDYYVRTLFHLRQIGEYVDARGTRRPKVEQLGEKIATDGFEAYLTGGADWSMMIDNRVSFNKNFIPDGEIHVSRLKTATEYRVVPFSRALDSVEIFERIKAASIGE